MLFRPEGGKEGKNNLEKKLEAKEQPIKIISKLDRKKHKGKSRDEFPMQKEMEEIIIKDKDSEVLINK